jgi:T5SS/PEP-CTERM-associated repeat protein
MSFIPTSSIRNLIGPSCGAMVLSAAALIAPATAPAQDLLPVLSQVIPNAGWASPSKTIAVRGEWMALSMAGSFDPALGHNRIEIWRKGVGGWTLHQTLADADAAGGTGLGATALAFDSTGTLLIAGDPRWGDPVSTSQFERTRIFRRSGNQWALDLGGELVFPPELVAGEMGFGWAVAVEGDFAIVSSPYWGPNNILNWKDPPGPWRRAGRVDFFRRGNNGWAHSGELYCPSALGTLPYVAASSCCCAPGCPSRHVGIFVAMDAPDVAVRSWLAGSVIESMSFCWLGYSCQGLSITLRGTLDALGSPQAGSVPAQSFNDAGGYIKPHFEFDQGRALKSLMPNEPWSIHVAARDSSGQWQPVSQIDPPAGVNTTNWGLHFGADEGSLVVATPANELVIYRWNPSIGEFGDYELVGVQEGPIGNPFGPPLIPADSANLVNGRKIVVDGTTLVVEAISGDLLIYDLFEDCDGNGIPDLQEIAVDPLRDCNGNGVLDLCEDPDPAAPSLWKAPFGGSFQTASNWCLLPPTNTSRVIFGLDAEYAVTFSQTREVRNIAVAGGYPTLNLGGFTLRTLNAGSAAERFLKIGVDPGVPAWLGVLGGTVNSSFGEIGATPFSEGAMLVGPGGKVISTQELCVGCEGNGQLLVVNGGEVVSQKAIIGKGPTSQGSAVVEFDGARWISTLGIDVKSGSLTVGPGGVIDSPAIGVILFSGGSLAGSGTIIGPVTNFGAAAGFCGTDSLHGAPVVERRGGLVPGGAFDPVSGAFGEASSIGTLVINGLYQQIAANPDLGINSGSLLVEVVATKDGLAHDRIEVNGPASLGGGLFVTLPEGDPGDFSGLPIFTASGFVGGADNFDIAFMPGLSDGRFVKLDAAASLAGGEALTISTSNLASLLGFGDPNSVSFDAEPLAAVAADFDGDGSQDIAVTLRGAGGTGNGTLLILFNDGTGGLSTVVQLPGGLGVDPVGIVAAPLRSGAPAIDIAVVNRESETLQILHNDGKGVFSTAFVVPTGPGSQPTSVDAVPIFAVDPLVADARDLVVSNGGSNSVGIWANSGASAPVLATSLPAGLMTRRVRGVDVDNNRLFDLIACNQGDHSLSVFIQQPRDPKNPNVVVFNDALTLAVGEDPIDFTLADLDGDGRIDIATVNALSNSVSILLNRSDSKGEAAFAPAVTLPTGALPASIVHGDLDDDGDLDLAFTAHATTDPSSPRVVKILRNDRENGVLILSPAEDLLVDGSPEIVLAESMDDLPGIDLVTVQLGGSESLAGGGPIASASVRSGSAKSPCADADLNCDGRVDGTDLAILLLSWGDGGESAADLNGDGVVDGADLGLLLFFWSSGS